jgi:hypothetical protein
MFSDTVFEMMTKILNQYFNDGVKDENCYSYEDLIVILTHCWIIQEKLFNKYDPKYYNAYKKQAVKTFKKFQCNRLFICPCDVYGECCDKCIQYDISCLYIFKELVYAEEEIKTHKDKIEKLEKSIEVELNKPQLELITLEEFIKKNPRKPKKDIEKQIQIRMNKELGGEMEVKTESGNIDLLTKDEIIEIKLGKNWKSAIGQVLSYSKYYPSHKKRIHLFNIQNCALINDTCKIYEITVSYEN